MKSAIQTDEKKDIEIIFHLGFHKTGSSSIQNFLNDYREHLLKHNILYPQHGKVSCAHHGIIWSIKRSQIAQYYSYNSNLEIFEKITHEIQKNKANKIILSSEFFSNLDFEEINEIKSILQRNIQFSPSVILYIRRQDITADSLYRQNVKTYETKEKRDIAKYLSQNWLLSLLNYYNLIENWKKVFPDAKIITRIYDRKLFPDGNVILDFLSILGIHIPEAQQYIIDPNPSLSHISTLVMRKINEKFNLSPEEHSKCIQYLFKLDREEGSPIKTFFTLPKRIEFLNYFKDSNERLFREWFNSENKFVLSEAEMKVYEEQDKIPKEEVEKSIEDRYRKVLTYLMEENIKPIVHYNDNIKPKITYYQNEKIEHMSVDVIQVDLLKGRIIVGGLVLLKEEINENLKLTSTVNGEEFEAKWRIPSPMLASKYPDNPNAKNARFHISGLKLFSDNVEIMLNEDKIIEIKFLPKDKNQ